MNRRQFLTGAVATGIATAAMPAIRPSRVSAAPFPGAADFDAEVAVRWFDQLLRMVRGTAGFSPPVAARTIGHAGVTLYEAVVGGMPEHRSLAGVVNDLPAMPTTGRSLAHDWSAAANAAMAHLLRQAFATAPAALLAEVDALEEELTSGGGARGVRTRSVHHGRGVADVVLEWARSDGGHDGHLRNFPTDYEPPTGAGLWRPTPPSFQRALQPRWGSNRPFVMPTEHVGGHGAPTPFSADPSSACFAEALEVYDTVRSLTDEQRTIARFWSDDPGATATPPGHSISILTQVLRASDASLELAAEAYARLAIAVADAFIACWRVKFATNVLRPITYINGHIDASFGPEMPLTTPPFPEFTSGHSVQSGASAEVLTALFGAVPFTDHTHAARGFAPRHFASFDAAAAEAAVSRLYGGIHYRPAIERGLDQGRALGALVNALPLRRS